jgi:hypothetical protein
MEAIFARRMAALSHLNVDFTQSIPTMMTPIHTTIA